MTLGMTPDSLTLRGDLSIAELSYDKRRFGNIDFGLYYKQDQGHVADARLTLDGAEVLTVREITAQSAKARSTSRRRSPDSRCSRPTCSCPTTSSASPAGCRRKSTQEAPLTGRGWTGACTSHRPKSAYR